MFRIIPKRNMKNIHVTQFINPVLNHIYVLANFAKRWRFSPRFGGFLQGSRRHKTPMRHMGNLIISSSIGCAWTFMYFLKAPQFPCDVFFISSGFSRDFYIRILAKFAKLGEIRQRVYRYPTIGNISDLTVRIELCIPYYEGAKYQSPCQYFYVIFS